MLILHFHIYPQLGDEADVLLFLMNEMKALA
jgi:hypothetical protein